MRNSVMVFVIIFLFTLPKFAMGGEVFSVKPLTSIAKQLNSKNRKVYRDFCRTMTKHYDKLDALFKVDTSTKSDPENEWQMICTNVQTDIIVAINSDIGLKNKGAGKWYATLQNLLVKLKSEGANTFNAKVKLDRLMAKKKKSLQELKTYKDIWEDNVIFFDKKITLAKKYREDRDKNSDSLDELKRAEAFAYNDTIAFKEYGKEIIEARKKDNPSLLYGKEKDLSNWEIKGEEFENFKNLLTGWQAVFVEHHKKYKKLYQAWNLDNSWVFDDTLFRNTNHMKGWTWQNFYENYMSAAKIWKHDTMEQTYDTY